MRRPSLASLALAGLLVLAFGAAGLSAGAPPSILDRENLSALWIMGRWDARQRGPEERMQMLRQLGLTRFAYNPGSAPEPEAGLDAEIATAQRHGIEIAAWWYPEWNPTVNAALRRHGIRPQLWVCGSRAIKVTNQAERIEAEAARLRPIAREAAALGCQVGLYNHREPWFEEQDNQIALLERLRREGLTNLGIVFNFHHWRGPRAEFPALFRRIQPWLIAVNLNGMGTDPAKYPSVRVIGSDESELAMIQVIEASGWRGPVGVIHERPSLDAAEGIRGNLQGLAWVQRELRQPGSGGPKPQEPVLPAGSTAARPSPDPKGSR